MKRKLKLPPGIRDMHLLIPMAKRRGISIEHSSRDLSSSSEPVESSSREIEGKMTKPISAESRPISGKIKEIEVDDPDKPSTDLRWHPKGILLRIIRLPGTIKRNWEIFYPPKTEAEQKEKQDLETLKSRTTLVKKEIHKYARQISKDLGQLGKKELIFAPDQGAVKRLKLVRFECASWDELFNKLVLKVNSDTLPDNVSLSQLALDPKYSLDLAPRVGHDIKWESDNSGCRVTIFRKGKSGIPDFVTIEELWEKFPDNRPRFALPVGIGDNSTRYWIDPTANPHLLVAGSTGGGKSNYVNSAICFWLNRGLRPEDFRLILFDLKKGLEFHSYLGLPHLYSDDTIKSGVIETLADVRPAMDRLGEILDERLELLKQTGFKNFTEYNLAMKPGKRLPAFFIFYDEWARIRLHRNIMTKANASKAVLKLASATTEDILREGVGSNHDKLLEKTEGMGKEVLKIRANQNFGVQCEEDLAEFTNLARAAGLFVVLATQYPSAEVLSGAIRVNFGQKIVMSTSQGGSQSVLGNWDAVGLNPPGRCILEDQGQNYQCQTAFITTKQITGIVERATTGKILPRLEKFDIGLEEIFEYALHNRGGSLEVKDLWEYFRQKHVGRDWIYNALREEEGKTVTVAGEKFIVRPRGHHTGRRLERF